MFFIKHVLSIATCIYFGYSNLVGWEVGQAAQTNSGTIIGHAAPNAIEVSEYLAIPYAQPPVEDLRFSPPLAYRSEGVFNATGFVRILCEFPSKL